MIMLETLLRESCMLVVLLSGLPLLVSTVCGLLLAVVQAATQIQEQTLSYVCKAGSVGIVLYVAGPWGIEALTQFIQECFAALIGFGHAL